MELKTKLQKIILSHNLCKGKMNNFDPIDIGIHFIRSKSIKLSNVLSDDNLLSCALNSILPKSYFKLASLDLIRQDDNDCVFSIDFFILGYVKNKHIKNKLRISNLIEGLIEDFDSFKIINIQNFLFYYVKHFLLWYEDDFKKAEDFFNLAEEKDIWPPDLFRETYIDIFDILFNIQDELDRFLHQIQK